MRSSLLSAKQALIALLTVVPSMTTIDAWAAPASIGQVPEEQEPPAKDPLFTKVKIERAFERAKEAEKLLFVLWSKGNDPISDRLLNETLMDPGLRDWLREIAICLQFDVEERFTLSQKYGVAKTPCITLIDPDGMREIDRIVRFEHTGYLEPTGLRKAIEGLLVGRFGKVEKPIGEAAKNPRAWLAWGNFCFTARETSDDALDAYIWLLEHADETGVEFLDDHFEFVVYRTRQLSTRTVRAKPALEKIRSSLEQVLRAGEGDERLATFYSRYNFWLRQDDRSIRFLEATREMDDKIHAQRQIVFRQVLARMVAERLYSAVVAEAGDMIGEIRTRLAAFEKERAALLEAEQEDAVADLLRDVRAVILQDAADFYETLLGVGRGKDAGELLEVLVQSEPSARSYVLLIGRAKRLELFGLAQEIAKRGIEAQGDNDRAKRQIDRALSKGMQLGTKDKERQSLESGVVGPEDVGAGNGGDGNGGDGNGGDGNGGDGGR